MLESFIRSIKVMEPILTEKPVYSSDFVYQVKWDGVRMLSAIEQGKVTLINRHQHLRPVQYPELDQLAEQIQAKSAVLDGEIIALKEGKPSFPSVMRRDSSHAKEAIDYLKTIIPITYVVFDLLYINGKSLINEPLHIRSDKLHQALKNNETLNVIEDFDNGHKLYQATKAHQLEGIVAKKRGSSYHAGKKHQDWFKIKHHQSVTCTVGGYTTKNNIVNSLLLGLQEGNKLTYIGKAATGLTSEHLEVLTEQMPRIAIKESPFANVRFRPGEVHFVQPVLQVIVNFLEWTDQGNLRSPIIKGFASSSGNRN